MHVYLMIISAHVADNTGSLALAVPLLTVVVPLDPTQSPLNPAHDKAISLVLGWATAIPVAFKEVMKLDQGVREVLEGSIRAFSGRWRSWSDIGCSARCKEADDLTKSFLECTIEPLHFQSLKQIIQLNRCW